MYALALTRADKTELRRFTIRFRGGPPGKAVLLDVELQGVLAGNAIVELSPLTRPSYDPVSLGTWIAVLSHRVEPVRTYHVSAPESPGGVFVVGGDGRIYQMVDGKDGVVVVRLSQGRS